MVACAVVQEPLLRGTNFKGVMGNKAKKNKMEEAAEPKIKKFRPAPDADIRKDVKKKMSGGMAIGGGHKNYKMTGMLKAKTGKLTEKQKNYLYIYKKQ
jgi:hypothetical protein